MQKHHASQHPAPVNALPVGTRLQEFEIKAVIGEGGVLTSNVGTEVIERYCANSADSAHNVESLADALRPALLQVD